MKLFPPVGIEYVASSAQPYAGKVTLLDLRYEKELCDPKKLLDFIRREVDMICVGISWDRQYEEICALLNQMPSHIPLIVGGHKATEEVKELFEKCPNIDVIVRGEGEETIEQILAGEPLEDILGISYRNGDRVVHNSNRELPDVGHLKPRNRGLRRQSYRLAVNGLTVTGMTFDSILSARGCPFKCKFCTFSLNPLGQKRQYCARPVEDVIREITEISADIVLFSDDNFCVDPLRAEAICDEIIHRKIRKRFIAQVRIEISKYPALLAKMVKAGFKILLLGIESPHDHILKQIDKGFDSAQIRRSFKILKRYPIYYHGYFIYGNIGETLPEMLYIAQFSKEIGVDSITFQKLRIEKFSPLKQVALATPGYHVTASGGLYSDTFSHAALKKIGRRIKFSFYTVARLARILLKCFKARMFTVREVFSFVGIFPVLLMGIFRQEIRKKRLADSLNRILFWRLGQPTR
jgi:radical SAM superfamily enzyme YgiQ (UPF0313 family)